jgi:ClpP class serine protease
MIGVDVALALSAAKKAFDLIQSAIDTGQQASGLLDQLGNFYDAKDKVQEAKQQHKPNGSYGEESVESYALKIIQAEIACDDYEAKIKKMFMAQGKTPLYQKMLRVRTEERDRRAAAQRELLKIQREKLQRQRELKNVIIALGALALCAGSAIFIAAVAVG